MALSKDQKQAQVKELTQKLSDAQSVIFAHYIGLSVAEAGELRSNLREQDAEMKVAKKTLMKIAAKEAGYPELDDKVMEGAVSCIFSYGDPLSGAQVAFKFSKAHDQVQLIGGVFDGKLLTKTEAMELAKMPSREILLATFAGMLQSPLRSFASMCNSPLSGFARALDQLAEKGGLAPEAEAPAEEAKAEEKTEEAPAEEAKTETEEKAEAPAEEATEAEAAPAEEKAEEASADTEEKAETEAPAEEATEEDKKDSEAES